MNRRGFFTKLGMAAATVAILPSATTYARQWVAPTVNRHLWVPNPEWVAADYQIEWQFWWDGTRRFFTTDPIKL
jgi:hypothetical protein